MKRSFSQPSTSGESGKRSRLFSLQQALDLVYDSDEDEQNLAHIYTESDLESVDSDVNSESSNEDEGLDVDLDLSSPAPRPSTAQVGRGTGRNRSRPTAGGDADNSSCVPSSTLMCSIKKKPSQRNPVSGNTSTLCAFLLSVTTAQLM